MYGSAQLWDHGAKLVLYRMKVATYMKIRNDFKAWGKILVSMNTALASKTSLKYH